MELNEIKDKDQWEQKISSQNRAEFLQSWDWAELQKSLGRKVWRLDLDGNFALAILMPLPLGKYYLYLARTNIKFDKNKLRTLAELAQAEKCIFIKIEPLKNGLLEFGFQSVKAFQPAKTLLIDLTKNEEDLLLNMHQKTRYNIRLAEKRGVTIRESISSQDLESFYNLINNTYARKGLHIYPKEYYQKLLTTIPYAKLYLAEFKDTVLCVNLVLAYGDTVTYLHGGSSEVDKNIMAPHLLQWYTIKKAKADGFHYYDFWGIDEVQWPGVTRFKKGFGGFEADYPGAYDFKVSGTWYLIYRLVKKFK